MKWLIEQLTKSLMSWKKIIDILGIGLAATGSAGQVQSVTAFEKCVNHDVNLGSGNSIFQISQSANLISISYIVL